MRSLRRHLPFVGLLLAAVTALAAPRGAVLLERPVVTTLAASATATRVQIVFPVTVPEGVDPATAPAAWRGPAPRLVEGEGESRPLPRGADLLLAVPGTGEPDWRIVDVRWRRPASGTVDWGRAVSVGPASRWRGVTIRGIHVDPLALGGALPERLVLEIGHPGDIAGRRQLAAAKRGGSVSLPPVPGLVNPDLAARLAAGAVVLAAEKAARDGTPSAFTLTSHWLKLTIAQTGIHRLVASQLTAAGIPAETVDPASLRLLRAWPLPLPADPDSDGSWQVGWDGLTEVPLRVIDGDGVWGPGDAIEFYAVTADDWRDRFVPGADPLAWQEHPYSATTTYWLTWEDYQTPDPWPASPLRVPVVQAPATGGTRVTSDRARRHLEQSYIEVYGRLLDNWAWDVSITTTKAIPFTEPAPLPGTDLFYRIELRSYRLASHSSTLVNVASAWLNDGDQEGETATRSWSIASESDSLRISLVGHSNRMRPGANTLYLRRDTGAGYPALILDSIDLVYRRPLEKGEGQRRLVHWGDEVASPGPFDLVITHRAGGVPEAWDVSRPDAPRLLVGSERGDTLTLGVQRDPGVDLHVVLVDAGEQFSPAGLALRRPDRLRRMEADVDAVVIHGTGLGGAAGRLAAHRSALLRGISSPRAVAVAVDNIYDAFGGGVKDPLALRNFCKWLWVRGGRLAYVCLLGDASRDYRGYGNTLLADIVPTVVRTSFPRPIIYYSSLPYPSDDDLVAFDAPLVAGGVDAPDLAVGRLPVQDPDEAEAFVERVIAYETAPPPGLWRNRVAMVADDFYQPSNQDVQEDHQEQAEHIVDTYLPPSLDVEKIYLSDYDYQSPSSFYKPLARQAAREAWQKGLTLFHYIGHGADNTLADEQVFLTQDIYSLGNGMRRGIFLAFSCDVGIFDNPLRQSMAEVFVDQPDGGAIGAIAAAQVSYISPNNALSNAFYAALYPSRAVVDSIPLGLALQAAKVAMVAYGQTYMRNSQRYHLFTDPALGLPQPVGRDLLLPGSVDTLRTGWRERALGHLAAAGMTPEQVAGYDLLVQEARHMILQQPDATTTLWHWLPGAPVFAGTGEVTGDTVSVPFKVPLQLRTGDGGRLRLILWTETGGVVQSVSLPVVDAPVGPLDDLQGPRIDLAFADGRRRVKPGTELTAVLTDTSGIAILGTTPLNSVLLEFDGTGFMSDVSSMFRYDPGSYTRGSLALPLPADLAPGPHVVALHASDGLGNAGSDTLGFQLVAGDVTRIDDVTPFPNPADGPVRLLFELSDPMTVTWEIFTLDGHRLHHQRHVFETAGPQILTWDGRDDRGDRPANGVYIYVLKGRRAADPDHPVTVTGRLVVMH